MTGYTPGCWFGANIVAAGHCDGQLVRCHLIPKQMLKREKLDPDDERTWVAGCGGPTGIGGHHGRLDHSRTLRIPREALPEGLEAFCAEHGLGWWLDREYGPRELAALSRGHDREHQEERDETRVDAGEAA